MAVALPLYKQEREKIVSRNIARSPERATAPTSEKNAADSSDVFTEGFVVAVDNAAALHVAPRPAIVVYTGSEN